MDNLFGLETAVEELRGIHARDLTTIDTLKETARTFIAVASIGLPLLSAAHLVASGQGFIPDAYRFPILIIAILGYIALMAICLKVLSPTRVYGPIFPTAENIKLAYYEKSRQQILETQVEQYLDISGRNNKSIAPLVVLNRIAGILLMVDTILLIALL